RPDGGDDALMQHEVGGMVGTADAEIPQLLAGLALLGHTRPEFARRRRRDVELDEGIVAVEGEELLAPDGARRARYDELPLALRRLDGALPILLPRLSRRRERQQPGEKRGDREAAHQCLLSRMGSASTVIDRPVASASRTDGPMRPSSVGSRSADSLLACAIS